MTHLVFVLALFMAGSAVAQTAAPQVEAPKGMRPAPDPNLDADKWQKNLDAYLRIQKALAKDHVKGVAEAASIIVTNAPNGVVRRGGERVRSAAAGKEALADTREQFKGLSQAVIDYTGANYAALVKAGARLPRKAYCPMAEASWVQGGSTIANPYYGSGMLTCGEFQPWEEKQKK